MDEKFIIRDAKNQDLHPITQLLAQVDLLTHDVLAPDTRYWVLQGYNKRVVGCLGMEFGKSAVLLKNLAILPSIRKRGLGEKLVKHAFAFAQTKGLRRVYLFSIRSGGYWQRLGFTKVEIDELVQALPEARQVMRFETMGKLAKENAWKKELV